MASRYHWQNGGGGSGGWNSAAPSIVKSTTLPANATLKKSVLAGCAVIGQDSIIGYPGPKGIAVNVNLSLSASSYGNRRLLYYGNAIPMQYTAFYDTITVQRVYSAAYYGGDIEMGHNEQMSYGGPGKSLGTVTLTVQFVSNGPLTSSVTGYWAFSWQLLYYL
jgi:hypothetical protein